MLKATVKAGPWAYYSFIKKDHLEPARLLVIPRLGSGGQLRSQVESAREVLLIAGQDILPGLDPRTPEAEAIFQGKRPSSL